MSTTTVPWGDEIATEAIGGKLFRMYSERPRRVEQLLAFTDRWGQREHIIQSDRVVSFAELGEACETKSRVLENLGVLEGDRVMILGFNSPDWIVNFWASLRVGAIPVLANAWLSEPELADALTELRPSIVLADMRGAAKIPAGWSCGPWKGDSDPAGVDPDVAPAPVRSEDENAPAVVIFTSGTAGRAKAVVLSHRSLLSGLQMLLHITRRLPHQLDGAPRDIGLHTGPMFHIGGVQTLLRAVTIGGTLVMPSGRFDAGDALELIERHGVTRWSAVPTMVSRVLEHPDTTTRDLKSLRSLTVGGAPVHAELLEQIRAGLPSVEARTSTGYGLTENGGQATAASGRDTSQRPGSSGRALPCVEITTIARSGLPEGEILVRSPTQMSGYYGDEPSPIDPDGWLHTGDLGHIDDDGHLWITGRSKDLIIRGGENIAPAAVERAIVALPGVNEAAVFGLPHPDLGEEVLAVVVVDGEQTPEQLGEQLRGRLASFAVPSQWRLRHDPLPVNHSGKVDKPMLTAQVRAELAAD